MLFHVLHAAEDGHTKIMIRTVDTDVVVLAISHVQNIPVYELWIAFRVGKHYRYIAAHQITEALHEHSSRSLFSHAFTGCDVISFFSGRDKKSAWHVWEVLPELTDTFLELASSPVTVFEDIMLLIEKFVEQVNLEFDEARQHHSFLSTIQNTGKYTSSFSCSSTAYFTCCISGWTCVGESYLK